jgi:hypothetical protein
MRIPSSGVWWVLLSARSLLDPSAHCLAFVLELLAQRMTDHHAMSSASHYLSLLLHFLYTSLSKVLEMEPTGLPTSEFMCKQGAEEHLGA